MWRFQERGDDRTHLEMFPHVDPSSALIGNWTDGTRLGASDPVGVADKEKKTKKLGEHLSLAAVGPTCLLSGVARRKHAWKLRCSGRQLSGLREKIGGSRRSPDQDQFEGSHHVYESTNRLDTFSSLSWQSMSTFWLRNSVKNFRSCASFLCLLCVLTLSVLLRPFHHRKKRRR